MTPERLEQVRERYADKQSAKEGLTSAAVNGPALGRLQLYAVIAAVSADDVPGLVEEVEQQWTKAAEWRGQRAALIELHPYDELIFGGFYCMRCSDGPEGPDELTPWPCASLRAVGVTDTEAIEIIKVRRAAIEAKAVRDAGA